MATVYTPAGETLEGVIGQLLDYYRGEGYRIVEDGEVAAQAAPSPAPVPVVESVQPVPEPVEPAAVDPAPVPPAA